MARQKLTVNLSGEVLTVLRDLAQVGGRSMTDELRLAIADRKFLVDQIRQGRSIEVVEPPTRMSLGADDADPTPRQYPVRVML